MQHDIKVSLILPSLNVEPFIAECLDSAINQTLQEIEIICVDACSSDGTREILAEYQKKDNRIIILDNNIRSYGRQVNKGMDIARGKYIAVLETDDFADLDMYRKLYKVAEEYVLEYAMMDFQSFYVNDEGERVYEKGEAFPYNPEIYGKVISVKEHSKIFRCGDSTLWRGIYNKRFLEKNHIRLNETPGAAYQDICFMNLVRMNSCRCMYLPETGYCYRTDRKESSSNSVKGLGYAAYEYRFLAENYSILQEYRPKMYYCMSVAFVTECANILPRVRCQWDETNSGYYEWMKKELVSAINNGLLWSEMGDELWWRQLKLLLSDKEAFAKRIKDPEDNFLCIKERYLQGERIIICGAGKRGRALWNRLDNASDILFADNSPDLWCGEVDSVENRVRDYKDAVFVIANKNYASEIKAQLAKMNVKKMMEYDPIINWN